MNITIPMKESKSCKWIMRDNGMMGFHSYDYITECGRSYDAEKVDKGSFCPSCGGKIWP